MMTVKRFNLAMVAVSTALVLTACGSDGGGGGGGVGREVVELNSAKVSVEPLQDTSTSAGAFATHLKNGLYTASIQQFEMCISCSTSSPTPADSAQGGFSQTNTQEAGVDESDRVKYDGDYLYIAANPYNDMIVDGQSIGEKDYVKVMKRQDDSTMVDVANVALPDGFTSLNGLYLSDSKLATVGSSSHWFSIMPVDVWHPVEQKVNVAVFDVQTPEAAELNQYISFDGYLIASRRVENKLYLVSSYSPALEGVNYTATTNSEKQQNYDTIQAMNINHLMPKMTMGGQNEQNLVEPENCYIPQDASSADGYDAIVTLTTIDLTQPNSVQSVCINTVTHAIYASTNAIYLMGSNNDDQSVIHKFSMSDNMAYVGAGTVDGYFGWGSPSFRLSEYQDRLRVVTSSNVDGQLSHRLTILDAVAQDKKLNVLSRLPNEQRPDAIGKPGEDIYAVRYFNDKAYVVTFERIDPLYVLDLSDVTDPKIAGALEVPGYSAYLHPINENLLLGVGQQIDPNRIPGNGEAGTSDVSPIEEGAKVALFDVSDPANPLELNTVVYSDGFTPVEWDHHTLTYLAMNANQHRFALPLSSWQTDSQGQWQQNSSLQMLEVNVTDTTATLTQMGAIDANDSPQAYYYISSYQDRSLLHDDDVYYVHGNSVIQGSWPQ